MRKSGVIFVLMLFALGMYALLAVAQEDVAVDTSVEIDAETRAEIDDIAVEDDTGERLGAAMRFLQLEFALKRRVLHMEAVIAYFNEKELDTTELERIVAEMNVLIEDVENVDLTLSHDELVEFYLGVKEDAKALVKEFRESVHASLSGTDIAELRLRIQNAEQRDALADLRIEIREKRRLVLSVQTRDLLEKFGESDTELVTQIEAGDLTRAEIRARLEERLRNAAEERRAQIRERLQQAAEEKRAEYEARVRDYVTDTRLEVQARAQARVDRVEAKIRSRLANVDIGGSY